MNFSKERPFLIVGAGKMGGAMLAGWFANDVDPTSIVVCDPNPSPEIRSLLEDNGVQLVSVVPEGLSAGIVLIAVKPQMMGAVLPNLKSAVKPDTLVLSVAAGTPVSEFSSIFGECPIARCMPNTPALVKRGITAVFPNERVSAPQKETIGSLLSAVGKVVWLTDEDQIDQVTGVSGSGPAYVFYLAEAMAKAGVEAGLPEELALELAVSTVCGAGELMFQTSEHPSVLRQNVTSPNGTTAAALDVLMADDGVQPVMSKAVEAAVKRARELAG